MDDKIHPMHAPVRGWKCASCEDCITKVENGWIEWLSNEDEQGNARLAGLRLVHRTSPQSSKGCGCRYDPQQEFRNDRSIVEGLPLERFIGADGLMLLLSFLAQSAMPQEEVLELIKRVQIPGYEQVRQIYQAEISEGLLKTSIGEGFYLQSEIGLLLKWAAVGEYWAELKAS